MCPFTRDFDGPTFATSAGITDGARFASQAEMRAIVSTKLTVTLSAETAVRCCKGRSSASVVSQKFVEEQRQILRLRKPQKTRFATLRMTVQLINEFQTQDTSAWRARDL